MILEENVPKFPVSTMETIFCSEDPSAVKPLETREVSSAELAGQAMGRMYSLQSKVFSPVDLGIPSSRGRQYTCLVLAPFLKFRDGGMTFEDLFFR